MRVGWTRSCVLALATPVGNQRVEGCLAGRMCLSVQRLRSSLAPGWLALSGGAALHQGLRDYWFATTHMSHQWETRSCHGGPRFLAAHQSKPRTHYPRVCKCTSGGQGTVVQACNGHQGNAWCLTLQLKTARTHVEDGYQSVWIAGRGVRISEAAHDTRHSASSPKDHARDRFP